MRRIPYEIMEDLVQELTALYVFSEPGYSEIYFALYLEYLQGCGWTDQEFDQETLSRIDASWETSDKEFITCWH